MYRQYLLRDTFVSVLIEQVANVYLTFNTILCFADKSILIIGHKGSIYTDQGDGRVQFFSFCAICGRVFGQKTTAFQSIAFGFSFSS